MGFLDGLIPDFMKESETSKGRKAYYHNPKAGVDRMIAGAKSKSDFKAAANKRWELVKDELGRDAAFKDPTYMDLMAKSF